MKDMILTQMTSPLLNIALVRVGKILNERPE